MDVILLVYLQANMRNGKKNIGIIIMKFRVEIQKLKVKYKTSMTNKTGTFFLTTILVYHYSTLCQVKSRHMLLHHYSKSHNNFGFMAFNYYICNRGAEILAFEMNSLTSLHC